METEKKHGKNMGLNIIHYTVGVYPYRSGGLVKYVEDLAEAQSKNSKVTILYPGKYKGNDHKTRIAYRKYKAGKTNVKLAEVNANPVAMRGIKEPIYFIDEGDYDAYIKFFQGIMPDILHLHTLLGLQPAMLKAAKALNVKIIYTTHDFFGICPKINLIRNSVFCEKHCGRECLECCKNGESIEELKKQINSELWSFIKKSARSVVVHNEILARYVSDYLRKRESLDQKEASVNAEEYLKLNEFFLSIYAMIDFFHFNSRQTEEEYRKRINIRNGKVLYIAHKDIADHRQKRVISGKLRICFPGIPSECKGFYLLKEVLDDLYYKEGRRDFTLNLYVQLRQSEDEYIQYHNPYNYDQLDKIMDQSDVMVVPSICKETFGFVVIEAISYGMPVMVSTNVAAKEICRDIVDIVEPNYESIRTVIQCYLDDRKHLMLLNEKICNRKMIFNYDLHVNDVNSIYQELLK